MVCPKEWWVRVASKTAPLILWWPGINHHEKNGWSDGVRANQNKQAGIKYEKKPYAMQPDHPYLHAGMAAER
jgi:hypothetical protein